MTGFFRDGYCNTRSDDYGKHTVCVVMTNEFLQFSKASGNDLSTPLPAYGFPGLKGGDKWCLCVMRWVEALENNLAPKVVLEASHKEVLKYITLEEFKTYAYEKEEEVDYSLDGGFAKGPFE